MHERVGIFINRFAKPAAMRAAKELANETNASVRELNGKTDVADVDIAVVAGGDGSVQSVMKEILRTDRNISLVVIPGGSENGLWHSLVHEHVTVEGHELPHLNRPFPEFYPGMVNEVLFHHAASWDSFIVREGVYNEFLRRPFVPRKLRGYLGGLAALLVSTPRKEYDQHVYRLVMTGPFIGGISVSGLSHTSIYDNGIGLIAIRGKTANEAKAKVGVFGFMVFLGKQVPPGIADIQREEAFTFPKTPSDRRVNVDGEVHALAQAGNIYVRKSERAVRAAAYVPYVKEKKEDPVQALARNGLLPLVVYFRSESKDSRK